MLDIQDKKYIRSVIFASHKEFKMQFAKEADVRMVQLSKQNESYMTALREGVQDDIKKIAELVADKQGKEGVREIVHEEIRPLKAELAIIKEEVISHGKLLTELSRKTDIFDREMTALRKDVNIHEVRMSRLEATA